MIFAVIHLAQRPFNSKARAPARKGSDNSYGETDRLADRHVNRVSRERNDIAALAERRDDDNDDDNADDAEALAYRINQSTKYVIFCYERRERENPSRYLYIQPFSGS